MPVTDTSIPAWLREKYHICFQWPSQTLWSHLQYTVCKGRSKSRSAKPLVPFWYKCRWKEVTWRELITKAKHKDYLLFPRFIAQIHIIENFWITEWKSNMRGILSPCYMMWKSRFQGSHTWTDSQTLEELWNMASCTLLLNFFCLERVRCRKHQVIPPCSNL